MKTIYILFCLFFLSSCESNHNPDNIDSASGITSDPAVVFGNDCKNFAKRTYFNGEEIPELLKHYKFYESCKNNIGSGCMGLASMYLDGNDSNLIKSVELFKKSCDLLRGDGCKCTGDFYLNRNNIQAFAYYKKSCELNYGPGCSNSGNTSNLNNEPLSKQIIFYERGCELDDGYSCNMMGLYFLLGKGISKNTDKALTYFKTACALNYGDGCRNYGLAFENGIGVKTDIKNAFSYYERGCELNSSLACGTLALLYLEGKGVRKNKQKAIELFSKSCELGEPKGCFGAGILCSDSKDKNQLKKGKNFLEKACSQGEKEACSMLK